jgi:murein DD-endopeptidase MepM/ murein hydrolase activator NlpD
MRKAAAATALALLLPAQGALAAGDPEIAALQVGLRAHGLYGGTVDGVLGGSTTLAVRRLQQKARIAVDGVPGPATRAALGRYGRRAPLGRRVLGPRMRGWDVAALQFSLAWHGFPSGRFDGVLGASTERALRKFQRWAGLQVDGLAGGGVVRALKAPPASCPIQLAAPLAIPYADVFGPRGNRFHTGVDYPAARGTPVVAAGSGRVTYAGWSATWGYLVTVAHAAGVRTMYAHLSRIAVRLGERVEVGERIGLVGSSGHVTGPHLHFEVRLRGAAVDPLGALV